jgi:hypothetical protein
MQVPYHGAPCTLKNSNRKKSTLVLSFGMAIENNF